MKPQRDIWFVLTVAMLALFVLFLLYPLARVLLASFAAAAAGAGASGWVQLVSDPKYLDAIRNTLVLGCVVTFFSALIGVPLAFMTARYSFPAKALIALLPITTLIVPEVIAAQTWLMMLGNNGLITRLLADWGIELPSFYGWFGLIAVMTFIYYTYVYIGTLAAIKGFDYQLEEASQSLGVSPGRSLWRVMLPVVLPAVLASCILVFTLVAAFCFDVSEFRVGGGR
jgi:iron(III) transport system permease protein